MRTVCSRTRFTSTCPLLLRLRFRAAMISSVDRVYTFRVDIQDLIDADEQHQAITYCDDPFQIFSADGRHALRRGLNRFRRDRHEFPRGIDNQPHHTPTEIGDDQSRPRCKRYSVETETSA